MIRAAGDFATLVITSRIIKGTNWQQAFSKFALKQNSKETKEVQKCKSQVAQH